MKSTSFGKVKFGAVAAVTGVLIAGVMATGAAHAACGDPGKSGTLRSPALYMPGADEPLRFLHTNFSPGEDEEHGSASIVGLWRSELRLKGTQNGLPDGFLFDFGLVTWHDDGTEIQFSAARPPSAGDICMGVWQQVGRGKFKLNHVALGLTPPVASGTYVGPVSLREMVHVNASGNGYSGTFTLTQYAAATSGTPFSEFDETQAVVTFVGTVSATRVTQDN